MIIQLYTVRSREIDRMCRQIGVSAIYYLIDTLIDWSDRKS